MEANNKNTTQKVLGIVRYTSGLIGFLAIIVAILAVTNLLGDILLDLGLKGGYNDDKKLAVSLITSIGGIFLLFIAFSKQLDKFFGFLETHTVTKKDEDGTKGVSVESVFFSFIAIILIIITLLLTTNKLILKSTLPLLGNATRGVLIGALIVLSILALVTAFNKTISASIKEMKKVHWPTGKEMIDYSKRVFSFIIFFSLFFFALDLLYSFAPGWIEDIFGINL